MLLTFGKIEGEGWLIRPKIVNMEDELIRQIFLAPPDDPSDSGVDETVFVSTDIDALHQRQPEIPFQLWVQEWCNESTTCRIYMDWSIPSKPNFSTLLVRELVTDIDLMMPWLTEVSYNRSMHFIHRK